MSDNEDAYDKLPSVEDAGRAFAAEIDAEIEARGRPLDDTEDEREASCWKADREHVGYCANCDEPEAAHVVGERCPASPHGLDDTERDKARREWKRRELSGTDPLLAGWAFDAGWDAAAARSHDGQEGAREAEPTPDPLTETLHSLRRRIVQVSTEPERKRREEMALDAACIIDAALAVRPGPGEDERP